ncbi:TPA: cyclic pyranopterin monophosphate synthase MoaC [Campylobacter fetus subsp. venerealis]|uniref:Cyclic pyranopterin monophosphate synthase n=1 Tax=Campylobacter fetus subsp. venerealis NCTC 10354 TaxID=983328 RepID=A0AAE6IX64_CAMFE|nr:cyclic pyranopterin monophosphate synthase MoaC [Campylobacter fetus]OCS22563.1 cyclic pyranopterin monophosphate synthase accessory protein [Campylobacter fetus subsp. venerealis cfvi97/532]OCS25380.1 cyclic pyranopterin monophosphate synthase accessory protein [Campylobacter fetus subsp. venerealis cfvB10]OCS29958.1 cyclic pyranopterin monophosphate synthase accessory protein [Campylobacter fetus subsp. venerealis LMG 6570 = CCUG 33900]OCS41773.1 cyclic pyranopterin monophosphate synthase 
MLTHLNEQNLPKMVDVGLKDVTRRVAVASGAIKMSLEAYSAIKQNTGKKGPVLQTAVVAAVLGAKKTSDLIPMCHSLPINSININIEDLEELPGFKLEATVITDGKTGVEMEALTSVSVGLLTIYDMIKAIDKSMEIIFIRLDSKSGGKSGDYRRKNG